MLAREMVALVIISCEGSVRQSLMRRMACGDPSCCCILEWLLDMASIFSTMRLASGWVTRWPCRVGLWWECDKYCSIIL